MARIRTIKPEFPQSESMGRVSREARLCFILLWTIADDSGRLRASSRMLASILYPYDDDAFPAIETWLGELEREGCIVRYCVDGAQYAQIDKWLIHQKIDRPSPSRFPEYNPNSCDPREASRILVEPSTTDLGPWTKDPGKGNPPTPLQEGGGSAPKQEPLSPPHPPSTNPSDPPKPPRKPRKKPHIEPTPEQIATFWREYPRCVAKPKAVEALGNALATGVTFAEIMAGVTRLVAFIRAHKTPEDKIPHPATWLNQHRWDDQSNVVAIHTQAKKAQGFQI